MTTIVADVTKKCVYTDGRATDNDTGEVVNEHYNKMFFNSDKLSVFGTGSVSEIIIQTKNLVQGKRVKLKYSALLIYNKITSKFEIYEPQKYTFLGIPRVKTVRTVWIGNGVITMGSGGDKALSRLLAGVSIDDTFKQVALQDRYTNSNVKRFSF